ncbi:MAG: response regulator [Magnetococcales bacterium]|nr:response regulator [Magnetococcales bacterium]
MSDIPYLSSLEYRFTVYVGLGMTLFSLLVGLGTYRYFSSQEVIHALALEQQLVQTVVSQAAVGAFVKNDPIAQDVMQGLLVNPIILGVRIESKEGFLAQQTKVAPLDFSAAVLHPLPSPVRADEIVGTLKVVVDLVSVQRSATLKALLYAGMLVAQIIVATVLLMVLVRHMLGRPVALLAQQMTHIHPGAGRRLTIDSSRPYDEIGLLSSSANALLDTADHAIDMEHRLRLQLSEALQAAEEANQSKSSFLANMSHEIRTPMNAIIGLTDLALQTNLTAQTRDYLTKVSSSSQSLLRLINDILDFSKIEANKLDLEQVPFFLRDTFDHLADLFRAKMTEKHLELILCASEECRYQLYGDPLRLEQILMNLVSNALKFTDEGEIEVQITTLQETVDQVTLHFSVRDTGLGMSQEQVARLFQPFSQADSSTTRRFGGTGLGLSISKQLVELMAGRLWVTSAPGQGSTFYFTANFQRVLQTAEIDDMTLPEAMEALRVLLVEDNQAARAAIENMLQLFGLTVTSVASGPEALAVIQQGLASGSPYPLALVDWFMPGMSGLDSLRQMNAMIPHPSRPKVILLVPFGREQPMRTLGDPMGVDGYITKPVNCSVLFDTIMDVFGHNVQKIYRSGKTVLDPTDIIQHIGGARVLLVEDNAINRQVAQEVLESVQLVVESAENGFIATQMLEKAPYDVVLMDIQMPVMDGYTATRHIRNQPRFADLPIVAMTANAMAGDREQCLAAGMNDHVGKPIIQKELFATLVRWIGSSDRSSPRPYQPVAQQPRGGESQEEVPDVLPGLDIAVALDRLNGNRPLLRSLLIEFQRTHSHTMAELDVYLTGKRKSDRDTARHIVHTIKGMAGNLAAHDLADAARALETILRDDQAHAAAWSEALQHFELALTQVLTSIDHMPHATSTPPLQQQDHETTLSAETMDQVKQTILALSELVRYNDVNAIHQLNRLKELVLNVTSLAGEIDQLDQCLDQFDFAGARDVLAALVAKLTLGKQQ